MSLLRTDVFVTDVERQFEWYVRNAGRKIAHRYLDAVEATCRLCFVPLQGLARMVGYGHELYDG